MTKDAAYIMAMSCAIPAIVGAIRYKSMDQRYRPFIYMLLLVPIVETIQYISRKTGMYVGFSQLCINLYLLVNFSFFLAFVHKNGYISRKLAFLLAGALAITAIVNLAIVGTPFMYLYYLLCTASCLILLVCVDILSKQMMAVNTSLLKNCWFWISGLYIVQHAYGLLIFGLYIFSMSDTPNGKAIGSIYHFVNTACYLLFVVAVLLIPPKKQTLAYQLSQTAAT